MSQEFSDYLTSYLQAYFSFHTNDFKNQKRHLLFVEGQTDIDFYENLFFGLKSSNSKYAKPFKEKRIDVLCDINSYTNRIKRIMRQQFEAIGMDETYIKKNIDNDTFLSDLNPIKEQRNDSFHNLHNCVFVIDAINYLNSNTIDVCKHLDAFGIIDKDFYHSNIPSDNFAITRFHDFECTLLFLFLPILYKRHSTILSDSFKEAFRSCVDVSIKQGLYEKASIDLTHDNNKYNSTFEFLGIEKNIVIKSIKEVTHTFFDNNSHSMSKFEPCINIADTNSFSFETYISNPTEHLSHINQGIIDALLNIYNPQSFLNANYPFSSLSVDVDNWLEGKSEDSKKNINKAFKLSNGHILLSLMTYNNCFSDEIKNEFMFDEVLRKYIIEHDLYDYLFKEKPLNKYYSHLNNN